MGLGRPPKLVAVNGSHRSNEEKEERKKIEEKIKVGRDLVAPEWLNDKV